MLPLSLSLSSLSLSHIHANTHTHTHLPAFLLCCLCPSSCAFLFSLQTGDFFGEVEGAVMNKLLTMGSFKRITLYDYQAMCRANKESSDSAHGLLDVPGGV
uniref:Calcium channel, voltage-dependent, alpha2/delta subunit 3 n=1 Tax=Mus musculus TaxID=10090 RepID=A0A286YCK6_MOUSE